MIRLMLFFTFVPTVSPLPISTDVQPIFSILGWLVIILKKGIKINFFELLFLGVAFLYLGLFSFQDVSAFDLMRKHVSLIMVFPVLLILRQCSIKDLNFSLGLSINFLLACSIFQFVFPSLHSTIIGPFYNRKEIEIGVRGWSGVMPEPTDLGFTSVCLIVICFLLYRTNGLTKTAYYIYVAKLLIILIGTISGSGVIALTVVILTGFFSRINSINGFIMIFVLCAALYFLPSVQTEIRSINLLVGLYTNFWTIAETTSFFYRILDNLIAWHWLIDSFGKPAGVGGMVTVMPYIIQEYNYSTIFPFRADYLGYLVSTPNISIKNVGAQLIIEAGILGLIFLIAASIYQWISKRPIDVVAVVFVCFLLYIFQSFPMIYPLSWASIAMLHRRSNNV